MSYLQKIISNYLELMSQFDHNEDLESLLRYILSPADHLLVLLPFDVAYFTRSIIDGSYKKFIGKEFVFFVDGFYLAYMLTKLGFKVNQIRVLDLVEGLLTASPPSLFLFGSTPRALKKIESKLSTDYPEILIHGLMSGYFPDHECKMVVSNVFSSHPSIVLLGAGSPKRELILSEIKAQLPVSTVLSVGGVFDILSGVTRHAPSFIIKTRLEWLYRFCQEPIRLSKRVFFYYPFFILLSLLAAFLRSFDRA